VSSAILILLARSRPCAWAVPLSVLIAVGVAFLSGIFGAQAKDKEDAVNLAAGVVGAASQGPPAPVSAHRPDAGAHPPGDRKPSASRDRE